MTSIPRRTLLGGTLTITAAGLAAGAASAVGGRMADAGVRHAPARTTGFVDTVLAAFKKYRLVAIGEGGTHGLQEHHDALAILLNDPRLPEVVDDVVVEFGNALHQPTIDRFTAGYPVDNADLRPAWRDTTQSPLGTWDEPVFEQFFRTIRAVNATLPSRKRIRVLLGDPPIDWSEIHTRDELAAFQTKRDSHAASVVEREVLRKRRRALICYGAQHVLHAVKKTGLPQSPGIEEITGEPVYVIATLAPLAGDPGGLAKHLAGHPLRTVIPTSGTWLGSFDAGNIYPAAFRGPSGGDPKNVMCGIPLSSVIDAGLYVGQPDALTVSRPNPAIYREPTYWAELQRRNDVQGGTIDLNSYRNEQPVRYTPQQLPPSARCP